MTTVAVTVGPVEWLILFPAFFVWLLPGIIAETRNHP
jgi:hypothetical protein